MNKTLIQLVLLLILFFIFFFISNKYFYNENSLKNSNNDITINKQEKKLSNKNLNTKNIDNEIINLTYEKIDINGYKYLIKAKKGILDSNRPNIVNMYIVEASLIYLNNEKLIISSKEAILNKVNFKTTFSNDVKLMYQEQTLESDSLEFLFDKNIAIFKDNVKYNNQNIEAYADIITINLLTKEIDIKSKNQKNIKIKKKN